MSHSKAISEQKALLSQSSSRKIFQQVKDDSSSLCGQTDSASIFSWRAGTLSRLSKLFDFDRQLFATKVYEKAMQTSFKDTVETLWRPTTPQLPTLDEVRRTARINQTLEEDLRKRRRECKVLVLGDPACTQTLMNHMRISHMRGFPDDERASCQGTVRNNVLDIVESLASISAIEFPELDDTTQFHATLLFEEVEKWEEGPKNITLEVACAVQGLWRNETLKSAMFDASDVYSSKSAP